MVTPQRRTAEAVLIVVPRSRLPRVWQSGRAPLDGAMTFAEAEDTIPVLYTDPNTRHMVKVTSLDVMPRILPDKTDNRQRCQCG